MQFENSENGICFSQRLQQHSRLIEVTIHASCTAVLILEYSSPKGNILQ